MRLCPAANDADGKGQGPEPLKGLSNEFLVPDPSAIGSSISKAHLRGQAIGRGWLVFSVLYFIICFSMLS